MNEAIDSGTTMASLALLGKTGAALILIVGLILVAAWILKRLRIYPHQAGQHLRVVSSLAVGQREKVVVVQMDGTWLVLGVGGGQVNKLHELPAPPDAAVTPPPPSEESFAGRFSRALSRQPVRSGREQAQ